MLEKFSRLIVCGCQKDAAIIRLVVNGMNHVPVALQSRDIMGPLMLLQITAPTRSVGVLLPVSILGWLAWVCLT